MNNVSEAEYGKMVLNGIIGGRFGVDTARWLLSNIFQRNIRINKNSPVKCCIPANSLSDNGYLLYTPMPLRLSSTMVFLVHDLDGSIFWTPTAGGNVFKAVAVEGTGYNVTTELDRLEAPVGCYSTARCLLNLEIASLSVVLRR